jgi:hypothetical protein
MCRRNVPGGAEHHGASRACARCRTALVGRRLVVVALLVVAGGTLVGATR